jgi:hypothetical protein
MLSRDVSYDSPDAIISALDQFNPDRDEVPNLVRLYEIFRDFETLKDRERALPSMFALLERFPEGEFGSPGPIVQAIEGVDGYSERLKASLARVPTRYTVWMVNRAMNGTTDEDTWVSWMAELQKVRSHPLADEYLRENAREFAEYQAERIEE